MLASVPLKVGLLTLSFSSIAYSSDVGLGRKHLDLHQLQKRYPTGTDEIKNGINYTSTPAQCGDPAGPSADVSLDFTTFINAVFDETMASSDGKSGGAPLYRLAWVARYPDPKNSNSLIDEDDISRDYIVTYEDMRGCAHGTANYKTWSGGISGSLVILKDGVGSIATTGSAHYPADTKEWRIRIWSHDNVKFSEAIIPVLNCVPADGN